MIGRARGGADAGIVKEAVAARACCDRWLGAWSSRSLYRAEGAPGTRYAGRLDQRWRGMGWQPRWSMRGGASQNIALSGRARQNAAKASRGAHAHRAAQNWGETRRRPLAGGPSQGRAVWGAGGNLVGWVGNGSGPK
jgi:hypothetical protein